MRPTEHGFVGPLAGELEEYIRFKVYFVKSVFRV